MWLPKNFSKFKLHFHEISQSQQDCEFKELKVNCNWKHRTWNPNKNHTKWTVWRKIQKVVILLFILFLFLALVLSSFLFTVNWFAAVKSCQFFDPWKYKIYLHSLHLLRHPWSSVIQLKFALDYLAPGLKLCKTW